MTRGAYVTCVLQIDKQAVFTAVSQRHVRTALGGIHERSVVIVFGNARLHRVLLTILHNRTQIHMHYVICTQNRSEIDPVHALEGVTNCGIFSLLLPAQNQCRAAAKDPSFLHQEYQPSLQPTASKFTEVKHLFMTALLKAGVEGCLLGSAQSNSFPVRGFTSNVKSIELSIRRFATVSSRANSRKTSTPPLLISAFLPLVPAVLITPKGAESPGRGRIGVIGALAFIFHVRPSGRASSCSAPGRGEEVPVTSRHART